MYRIANFFAVAVFCTATVALTMHVRADIIENDPSLIAYWKLDDALGSGTAADSGPSGTHNGSVSGAVTLGQPSAMPLLGTSATFQATTGQISIPYDAALNPSAFTAEAWAQVDERTYYHAPMFYRSEGPPRGWNFYAAQSNYWQLWTGDGDGPASWTQITGATVVSGQWVHLVGSHSGTTQTFYMNGCPVGTRTAAYDPAIGGNLRISPAGGVSFDGNIDNVAMFNQALSDQTVADHYNSFSKYAGTVLADTPANYWRLGEQKGTTAYDATGNNTGSYSGGAAIRQFDAVLHKDIDTAVAFDGGDDYLETTVTAAQPRGFSVEAWFKTDNDTGHRGLVNKYLSGSSNGFQTFISNGELNAWYYTATGSTSIYATGDANLFVADGRWHHHVATFDTGGVSLYLDGQLVKTAGWSGTAGNSSETNPLIIGRYDHYFDGLIDEVALYNDVLTADQVMAHFQAGVPEPCSLALFCLGLLMLLPRRRRR